MCHHWTWQVANWPRQLWELLIRSSWILKRCLQGAQGRPDWTMSQVFFSPDLYQWLCEDVTPQNLCSNAWVPTRARTEPAESTGLPRLLAPSPPSYPGTRVHTLSMPEVHVQKGDRRVLQLNLNKVRESIGAHASGIFSLEVLEGRASLLS